jgi:DNA repair protein RecN (Recombination protein N)
MLRLLRVTHFALIEELTLEFHPGLNVLSGETGAGKSLIVDALGLLAGARASTEQIRSGEDRAVVEAVFDLSPGLLDLSVFGLDHGPDRSPDMSEDARTLILRREIASDDRNRVYVNNQPATVSTLRAIAALVLDIHGQHEQQTLLSTDTQLGLIDRAAGVEAPRARVAELYEQILELRKEIATLDSLDAEALRRQDLLAFQKTEIENLQPQPGESDRLRQSVQALEHSGRLLEAAGSAYEALYESDGSLLGHLATLERSLGNETAHDPRLEPILQLLGAGRASLQEAAWELRAYLDRLDADPGSLEQLQTRLAAFERLERKYGPDLPAHLERVLRELDTTGLREDRRARIVEQAGRLETEIGEVARELSRLRRRAAAGLARRVTDQIRTLAMPDAGFSIEWDTLPVPSRTGIDRPVWTLAPNPGEAGGPLSEVASGGELSRTMLAVRSVLAGDGGGRTLVFDEIDAGVGGEAADRVGGKLRELAGSYQVLCVTHLPQIARFAEHHARIEKRVEGGRTRTVIEFLDRDRRVEELARMMSGKRVTAAARRHVHELLDRKDDPGTG